MSVKKKILLFTDWYEPGFKAGGPIRSSVNFVEHMKAGYSIFVFTSDRDLNSREPYPGIISGSWNDMEGDVKIYYCPPQKLNWDNIFLQINNVQAEFIYLNSMFSKYFTIFPLLAGKAKNNKSTYFLSPRGMLRASALQYKPAKKKLFLSGFRWLNYHKRIRFIAADQTEMEDVKRFFGNKVSVTILPNFSGAITRQPGYINKQPGELSIIFVGRIHPVKNPDYLLNVLKKIKTKIRLTIIGSLEDVPFWNHCLQIIATLPENISVNYLGEKPNHELPAIVNTHHIFALPTKGENFGHAIAEALNLGRPVLISDQTPWRNLEREKAGWDLSLQHPELFVAAIEKAAAFGQSEYDRYAKNAWEFAKKQTDQNSLAQNYKLLFS